MDTSHGPLLPTRAHFLNHINIPTTPIVLSSLRDYKRWLVSESTREAKDPEILIQEVEARSASQEFSRNGVGGDHSDGAADDGDGGDDSGDDDDDDNEGEDDDGYNDGDAGDKGSNLLMSTDFLATGTVLGAGIDAWMRDRSLCPLENQMQWVAPGWSLV